MAVDSVGSVFDIDASASSDSAARRIDSEERSELERTESKTRCERLEWREASSERRLRTSESGVSWRERVRVSKMEEILD